MPLVVSIACFPVGSRQAAYGTALCVLFQAWGFSHATACQDIGIPIPLSVNITLAQTGKSK